MIPNDKISVIIPTHERASGNMEVKFLRRSIDSVINQTIVNPIELIVIIDGKSSKIINFLKKIQINNKNIDLKIFETIKKLGGSGARNYGIKKSTGNWIALLDDDDEWLPQKLEKQFNALKNLDELTFCFTSVICNEKVLPNVKWNNDMNLTEYLFCSRLGKPQGLIQTSTLFAHRNLFEKSMFTDDLPQLQDLDWEIKTRFSTDCDIVFIEEPLSIFYTDGSAKTRVSRQVNIQFFEQWLDNRREMFSPKGQTGFIMNIIVQSLPRSDLSRKEQIKNAITKFRSSQKIYFSLESVISLCKFFLKIVFRKRE